MGFQSKKQNTDAIISEPSLPRFSLIETLLWEKGEFFLLNLHLTRLQKSAQYFSYPYNKKDITKAIKNISDAFDVAKKYRIRLILKKSGELNVASNRLKALPTLPVKITFSNKRTDKNSVFFFHKTTNRAFYDKELTKYRKKGFFDVVFLNQDNEITEGAITNIIIQKNGNYLTPPLSSGLLNGVYRQYLLETDVLSLKEKILYKKDLLNADKIFVVNSVRKMLPAILIQ